MSLGNAVKAFLFLSMCGLSVLSALIVTLSMGSQAYVEKDLPKYGTPNENPIHNPIIQLHRDGRGFCSAVVIDANYALTADHCLRGFMGMNSDPIQIHDELGKATGVEARAVGIAGRVDVGLIKGDFRRFKFLRPDFYGFTPTNAPGEYRTCGFPGLQDRLTCTVFIPTHNSGFAIAGRGFLIPGMSGGPVIDLTNGVVIAVNSAATEGFVLVAPIMGVLGVFGIEP